MGTSAIYKCQVLCNELPISCNVFSVFWPGIRTLCLWGHLTLLSENNKSQNSHHAGNVPRSGNEICQVYFTRGLYIIRKCVPVFGPCGVFLWELFSGEFLKSVYSIQALYSCIHFFYINDVSLRLRVILLIIQNARLT